MNKKLECWECDGLGVHYSLVFSVDGICSRCGGRGRVSEAQHEDETLYEEEHKSRMPMRVIKEIEHQ